MHAPPQDRPWLPHLLRAMAEDHGLDRALRFAGLFGGRYLHLPARATAEHPVAAAVGIAVLQWLIDRHDHLERIVVPKGPDADRAQQLRAVRALVARDATADEIAAETGLHVRTAHRLRARLRDEDAARQPSLFPLPERKRA